MSYRDHRSSRPISYKKETREEKEKVGFHNQLPREKSAKPLVGYRCWNTADGKLYSITSLTPWEGPLMTTRLYRGKPTRVFLENPARRSLINGRFLQNPAIDFGVYSFKSIPWMLRNFPNPPIWGKVESYGHVVEHEHGYRAQYCMIRDLCFTDPSLYANLKPMLSNRYGCSVFLVSLDAASNIFHENP